VDTYSERGDYLTGNRPNSRPNCRPVRLRPRSGSCSGADVSVRRRRAVIYPAITRTDVWPVMTRRVWPVI